MRFVRIGLWTLAIALLLPRPALAASQEREGFWIGFGFGYGSALVRCDDCVANGREGGVAGFLKLGGTLNRKVLLGAEFSVWTKTQAADTLDFGTPPSRSRSTRGTPPASSSREAPAFRSFKPTLSRGGR
jgi:hypothetical protein